MQALSKPIDKTTHYHWCSRSITTALVLFLFLFLFPKEKFTKISTVCFIVNMWWFQYFINQIFLLPLSPVTITVPLPPPSTSYSHWDEQPCLWQPNNQQEGLMHWHFSWKFLFASFMAATASRSDHTKKLHNTLVGALVNDYCFMGLISLKLRLFYRLRIDEDQDWLWKWIACLSYYVLHLLF